MARGIRRASTPLAITSSPGPAQKGGEGTVGAVLGGEDADGFSELEAVGYGEGFHEGDRLQRDRQNNFCYQLVEFST